MTPTQRKVMHQALDALQVATTPLAKDRQEVLKAMAALRAALAEPVAVPIGYVRMLNGEPTPDDDGCVFSYGKNPYQDTYGDEEWVPVSLASPPPPAEVPLLTQAEINEIDTSEFWDDHTPQDFARAIESLVRQNAGLK